MGRLEQYVELISKSRLVAPNLKQLTLWVHTGNLHKGNAIGRKIIKDHLLGLRWMNPNAVVYLREEKGQGTARIDYELWTEPEKQHSFEIAGSLTPEEAVAKVLMACRDPSEDDTTTAPTSTAVATKDGAATAATAGVRPSSSSLGGAGVPPVELR